jgi:hypothetical protein
MSVRRLARAAVLLLVAVSCVAPVRAQSVPDAASLHAIEDQVQQIRGLAMHSEPPVQVLDHTALRQFLTDELERDYLPNERESDQKELVALGLIQPSDNLLQIQLDLLTDQVIGVYDSDTKSMYVVGDAATFGPAERITFAHEFNHALQDQHYGLDALAPKHANNGDRSLAVHALIEGDAVMLQTLWAQTNLSQNELLQLVSSSGGEDDVLAQVPAVVRTDLLFPYVQGLSFVRQAYRQAGNSYAAVDELFRHPPTSTAQILHPEKYRAHVEPVEVVLPDLAAALGPDWRRVGSGVLGELNTRVLLEQYGDHWQLVERDGQVAMVLESVWESEDAASSFFSAYSQGLRTRFPEATTDVSTATRVALSSASVATDLRLDGRAVRAVLAPDRQTSDALLAALGT